MSTIPADPSFRRILVALDASRESRAALAAAAGFADRLEAEITGVFIEDIDLLNLAALPFSREIPALSMSGRVLDPDKVEHALLSTAAAARRALAAVAETHHLRWTFRVVRGHVETELLTASQDADLVAVGKGTRPLSGDARLGRAGRVVASQTARSVLFAATGQGSMHAPMAIIYDASSPSAAALDFVTRLAEANRRPLVIFVLSQTPAAFAQQEALLRERLRDSGISGSIRQASIFDPVSLLYTLQSETFSLLVVGGAVLPLLPGVTLDSLIAKCQCSVLLLRR